MDPGLSALLLPASNATMLHCRHGVRRLPGNGFAVDQDQHVALLRDVLMHSTGLWETECA